MRFIVPLFDRLHRAPGLRRAAAAAMRALRDRRGNVMMITAFALIPMTFATGMAIDYSRAARLQTKLNAAADAAALSAITNPMLSKSTAAACNAARNTFLNALQQHSAGVTLNSTTNPVITITESYDVGVDVTVNCQFANATLPTLFTLASKRTAKVSYAGTSSNAFGGVLGAATIEIGGTGTATGSPITYIDYYILLDVSQSMGIGATQADMQAMYDRSKSYNGKGCVFGCHVKVVSGWGTEPYANEDLAHNYSPRINLRIDAAVSAIQTIIKDAKDASGTDKNIRVGVYTMSDDPVSGIRYTKVSDPTTSYDSLSTTVAGITLGNNVKGGSGDSSFDYAIDQLKGQMPLNGTGLTALTPKNYVFIITDALRDTVGSSCTSGHCTSAFDSTLCTPLKAKSTVGTIYTTYLPIYSNNKSSDGLHPDYNNLAKPYITQLVPAMQACASNAGLYYEASDGPAIDAAMKSLFASTWKTARLSQ